MRRDAPRCATGQEITIEVDLVKPGRTRLSVPLCRQVPPQYCDTLNYLDAAWSPRRGIFSKRSVPYRRFPGEGGVGRWEGKGERSSRRELRQMKSQLGQRVAGAARRIPSTSPKRTHHEGPHCVGPRGENEAPRAVGSSRGGVFHLCQPPLERRAGRPRKAPSRIMLAALRHRTV